MPTSISAAKRMRQSAARRVRNLSVKQSLIRARRSFQAAVEKGNEKVAQESLRSFFSVLDKATKKKIIKQPTADRSKARATARFRRAFAATA